MSASCFIAIFITLCKDSILFRILSASSEQSTVDVFFVKYPSLNLECVKLSIIAMYNVLHVP